MKKNFLCLVVLLVVLCNLIGCSSNSGCEHEWNDATLDLPKTCSKCQVTEGTSISIMLNGIWIEEGSSVSYVCIEIEDKGYKCFISISGNKNDAYYSVGTVELEGQYINLMDTKLGEKFSYYTYEILEDDTIKLTDYDGKVWIKPDVLPD